MGVGPIHARDLDHFVRECDRLGGPAHPNAQSFLADYSLRFDTKVEAVDPFSEEYFRQQEALHAELANAKLEPQQGELFELKDRFDGHVSGCNPYNLPDIRFISKHTRTVHTCMMMADLRPGAKVLDAGAGWGLSTEAMAFCGAEVTALDINPDFVRLVDSRAKRLGLPIKAVQSEFDTFDTQERFDLIFFYECLHHSRKPWETLARFGRFLAPEGKIIFAGEPVQAHWWKHWGIRLDCMSVYCIHKYGWWESGWSAGFIANCFARAGLKLDIYDHVGLDNGLIGVAVRNEVADRVRPDLSVYRPVANLQRLTSSRFWRLTAPLRAGARLCRRLLRRAA